MQAKLIYNTINGKGVLFLPSGQTVKKEGDTVTLLSASGDEQQGEIAEGIAHFDAGEVTISLRGPSPSEQELVRKFVSEDGALLDLTPGAEDGKYFVRLEGPKDEMLGEISYPTEEEGNAFVDFAMFMLEEDVSDVVGGSLSNLTCQARA